MHFFTLLFLLILHLLTICPNSPSNAAHGIFINGVSNRPSRFIHQQRRTDAPATSTTDAQQMISRPGPLILKETDTAGDEPMSAETLQALLSIGLYFNGTAEEGGGEAKAGEGGGTRKKQKNKPPAELSCNAQEKSMCHVSGTRMCLHRDNASDFECLCRKGYAGRFCQFSLFPRTCADALAFLEDGELLPAGESGVWQLDIDGSGRLPATHAECVLNGGITLVSHNGPADGFAVRGSELRSQFNQSIFFPISYKLFSPAHLRALIARSEHCEQSIRFDCEQSPLDFKGNRTWLEVASREGFHFRQLGTQPFTCACRNKELYGCGRSAQPSDLACYCDDPGQPSATDAAILRGTSAAVTAIYLRRSSSQSQDQQAEEGGSQRIALGPLEYAGEAGTSQNALVTLRSPTARLETGPFSGGWQQLELDFRTWQPDIEHMVTGWAPEGKELQLKISLRAGHRIELTISHHHHVHTAGDAAQMHVESDEEEEEEETAAAAETAAVQQSQKRKIKQLQERAIRRELSVSIASTRPLNDLTWHRLVVEIFRAEIRFSIDRLNAFQPLTFPFPGPTKFALGGDEHGTGFVGCVGNFRVDQRLVDWRSQLALRGGDDVRLAEGCADLCLDNQCQQGARCVEHFDTESSHCECQQPRIHFGEHCENNVNDNSSVALLGTGFLRFEELPVSALHADVVFSTRTDQRRALLLYEHDHMDNFVQIHLADEYRIVLTLNNLSRLLSCTVEAKPGTVFNDMVWRQFVLERDVHGPGSVALHVDDNECQLGGQENGGPILLMNSEMIGQEHEEFDASPEFDEEDLVLPPVPVGHVRSSSSASQQPFHVVFLGGVTRGANTRRSGRRLKKIRRRATAGIERRRQPLYLSTLPSLRGCIRGLLVDGEKIDLRGAVENGSSQTVLGGRGQSVRIGCEQLQCETLNCRNGGVCQVDWRQSAPTLATSCDCARTSFQGKNCSEEIGLDFPGHASVVFDMAQPRRFSFLEDSEHQTLAFAFSSIGRAGGGIFQQLATLYFDQAKELHMVLDANGTLGVALFMAGQHISAVHNFSGNFTDGHRHFFRAHFSARKGPLLSLDGIRHQSTAAATADLLQGLSLANVQQFYFGGMKDMDEQAEEQEEEEGGGGGGGGGREGEEYSGSGSMEEWAQRKLEDEEKTSTTTMAPPSPSPSITNREETIQENAVPAAQSESILMADAMREILARQATAEDATVEEKAIVQTEDPMNLIVPSNRTEAEEEEMVAEKGHKMVSGKNAETELLLMRWPKRVEHFHGCISNVAIEFEREPRPGRQSSSSVDSTLRFSPLLYYLQEDEFLHRSVRTEPLDLPSGGRLAPASCGDFHVPPPPPLPVRDVQFPLWEAPFHPVPFADWDPEAAIRGSTGTGTDIAGQQSAGGPSEGVGSAVWMVSALLIAILLLCLLCCCCHRILTRSRRRRSQSAEFYNNNTKEGDGGEQRKPMLGGIPKKNGPSSSTSRPIVLVDQSSLPTAAGVPSIQLINQRPISSPVPAPPSNSPVPLPRLNVLPQAESAQQARQPPKSILRAPGQQRRPAGLVKVDPASSIPASVETPATPGTGSKALSESGTSSGASYYTARDFFPPDMRHPSSNSLPSSGTSSSFVSLEQPTPPRAETDEAELLEEEEEDDDLRMMGRQFEEQAPELMDESTLELSNGGGDSGLLHSSSSSFDSSSTPFASRMASHRLQNGPSSPAETLVLAEEEDRDGSQSAQSHGQQHQQQQPSPAAGMGQE